MRCPQCKIKVPIAYADQLAESWHWRELAGAFEERGNRMAADLHDVVQAWELAKSDIARMRRRMHELKQVNEDLRAQLSEFKQARRSDSKPIRRIA